MISSGVNTRELILEILLQIEEEGEHSHIAIRNASFFRNRREALLQEYARELWNTEFILIM